MRNLLTIAAVVVAMAGVAFVITMKVIKPRFAPGASTPATVAVEPESKASEADHGEVYLVSNLLVNPTGTAGTRYLSATLGLELLGKETAELLRARDVQVRDLLLSVLASRTVEQLTDFQSRDQMRQEILMRLNQLLGAEKISAVYFVDYVLQ
ncbi:MAG: flagellar basal body-associated FliL family protein [Candidatus Zixiibacteriota bacterium]